MPSATQDLSSRNLPANGETQQGTSQSIRQVSREACRRIDAAGGTVLPAQVRTLATNDVRAGHFDLAQLHVWVRDCLDGRRFSRGYADPTGEGAVRNVMRGGPDAAA